MTLELPSEVRDRNYLFMPLQTTIIESDEEYSKCGKWILTNHTGSLLWIDEVWKKLQVLLKDGTLIRIKVPTAAMEDFLGNVMCFTKPGINEIKRAAEEIRKIVKYESCMYYKINSLTECGISRRNGYNRVANYMHSFRGFLYKADENEGWILESDIENQLPRPPISLKRTKKLKRDVFQLYSLPSKTRKMFLDVKNEWDRRNNNLYIYTGCSMEEEEHGLTVADRLWIVGMKLMDEGYVKRMTCEKNVTKKAEFRFYFCKFPVCGTHFSYEPIVELCDTLYRKAHYYGFMYFILPEYKKDTSEYKKYTYSPEGELYEDDKFVFLKK